MGLRLPKWLRSMLLKEPNKRRRGMIYGLVMEGLQQQPRLVAVRNSLDPMRAKGKLRNRAKDLVD